MKFLGFIKINCNLRVLTGLHIGGGTGGIAIGATDNPVIKGSDGKPYIPGSSLKGKIRSLLELTEELPICNKLGRHECVNKSKCEKCDSKTGCKYAESNHTGIKACDLCIVFGRAGEYKTDEGPTRVIFRDCKINEELSDKEARKASYTEIKYENAINRITSRVEYGLRDSERVLPGTVFNVEIVYRVFDADMNGAKLTDIKSLENLPDPLKKRLGLIIKGMKLLEEDYLEGCGTRGYGKVKFENLKIEILPLDYFVKGDEPIKIFEGELREAKIG